MALDLIRIALIIFEGSFSFVLACFILKKASNERFNQLFTLTLILFGSFFLSQIPMYLLAPLGEGAIPFNPIIQLARDVSSCSGIFATAVLLITSFYTRYGDEIFERRYLIISYIVIIGIFALIGQLNDHVVLNIQQGYHYIKSETLGQIFCYVLPLTLLLIGTGHFIVVWHNIENPTIKRNLMLFFIGFCLIIIGLVTQTFIVYAFSEDFYRSYPIFDYFIYIIWAIGQMTAAKGIL